MADLTLTGIERSGDTLTLTGTGFTKTTTTVFVEDASVPFELVSDTEITITPAPSEGSPISVEKGGVTSAEMTAPAADAEADETAQAGHTADTSTSAEGDDDTADATVGELADAANVGAADKATPQNPKTEITPEVRGEHVAAQNFREAVHQSPVTRVEEDLGIGVRDPYPTGNPPDPREAHYLVHGFYPKENADA